MSLERKIQISQARIIEWYKHWNGQVVVSFSGGKDSTVLLHLVRSIYPDVKAVFSNTGLEYPEIQKHVMGIDNVDIVKPSMRFDEVISTYGYPLIGKEVAEAIYYARRIRSQSLNVERERERAGQPSGSSGNSQERESAPATDAPRKKVTNRLQIGGGHSSTENPGAEPQMAPAQDCLIQTSAARNRRTILMGRWEKQKEPETEPG